MRVSKKSWHYRLWGFTHFFSSALGFEIPEWTILCRYIGRIILCPVPVFLGITMMFVILGGTLFVLPNVATILAGYGTLTLEEGGEYRRRPFPGISVRGRIIPMWAIVSPAWLLIALVTLVVFFPSQMGTVGIYVVYGVCSVAGGAFALYVLNPIVKVIRAWKRLDIAREYVKAKKRWLCQSITFDES